MKDTYTHLTQSKEKRMEELESIFQSIDDSEPITYEREDNQ